MDEWAAGIQGSQDRPDGGLFLLDDCAATTEMDKMEGKLLRECLATKVPEMNEVEGNLLDEQTAPEMAFSII